MDDILFFAFSNSTQDELPSLSKENMEVYNALSDRDLKKKHFRVRRESSATIPELTNYLIELKNQICLFHYSGHAGRDNILLEDQKARSEGIAQILGQCPNLKLVVLNGCSTKEQVSKLLNEDGEYGVPIVIATSRPVQDDLATTFAITFYKGMGEQYETVGSAFETAMGAVNTLKEKTYDTAQSRGIVFREGKSEEPLWGIYVRMGNEDMLNWSLPKDNINEDRKAVEPNKLLFEVLFDTLAREKKAIEEIKTKEDALGSEVVGDNKKRELVLLNLPHPVSEQLRKLIVPGDSLSGMVFYDKVGSDRLQQLVWCYKATMEFIAFTLLSQLWDIVKENPDDWKLTDDQTKIIRAVFQDTNGSDEAYPYEKVIKLVLKLLKDKDDDLFVKELANLTDYPEKESYHKACTHLATIQNQLLSNKRMDNDQAEHLCLSAEEHLAEMFKHVGFISRYKLMSIKNIDVRKQRHLEHAQFIHQVIPLEQNVTGRPSEDQDVLTEYMENGSVILVRCKKEACCEPSHAVNSIEHVEYLNLTPFIFDENAYNDKAPLAKIHFFYRYNKAEDILVFKHIYKSKDDPFKISNDRSYKVIKAQFDTFSKLMFNMPLNDAT